MICGQLPPMATASKYPPTAIGRFAEIHPDDVPEMWW
jgi:hypothetical protein